VALPQLAAQDLARGVARQGVDEIDAPGDLEGGNPLARPGDDVGGARLGLRLGDHHRLDRLAPALVGHAEPVFGHIKQARGFRQFLLRGLDDARAEWALICTVHNLLKLAAAP